MVARSSKSSIKIFLILTTYAQIKKNLHETKTLNYP
ncbi:hypothetical protein NEOC65_001533 [Neochlamydia sp. AcF65]|nr:hypothetical protein [Neochlamydia sp. AcF65]